jgi:hypothetical protein
LIEFIIFYLIKISSKIEIRIFSTELVQPPAPRNSTVIDFKEIYENKFERDLYKFGFKIF